MGRQGAGAAVGLEKVDFMNLLLLEHNETNGGTYGRIDYRVVWGFTYGEDYGASGAVRGTSKFEWCRA